MPTQKSRREERPQPSFGSFHIFFLLLLGLPCVNWGSQECYLFDLRSSLLSSDLPLSYFRGLFPSVSFNYCHSGLLFPIRTTYRYKKITRDKEVPRAENSRTNYHSALKDEQCHLLQNQVRKGL